MATNKTVSLFRKSGTVKRSHLNRRAIQENLLQENSFKKVRRSSFNLQENEESPENNIVKDNFNEAKTKTEKKNLMSKTLGSFHSPRMISLSSNLCRFNANNLSNTEKDIESLWSKNVSAQDFYKSNYYSRGMSNDVQNSNLNTLNNSKTERFNLKLSPSDDQSKIKIFHNKFLKKDRNLKTEFPCTKSSKHIDDLHFKLEFVRKSMQDENTESLVKKDIRIMTPNNEKLDLHRLNIDKFNTSRVKSDQNNNNDWSKNKLNIFKKKPCLAVKIKSDLEKYNREMQQIEKDIKLFQNQNIEIPKKRKLNFSNVLGDPLKDFKKGTYRLSSRNIDTESGAAR